MLKAAARRPAWATGLGGKQNQKAASASQGPRKGSFAYALCSGTASVRRKHLTADSEPRRKPQSAMAPWNCGAVPFHLGILFPLRKTFRARLLLRVGPAIHS